MKALVRLYDCLAAVTTLSLPCPGHCYDGLHGSALPRRSLVDLAQGLSQYLETGCPNRDFIDFCVSKVWYKIHTTNIIDPIPLQILLF